MTAEDVALLTELLRSSPLPYWTRLRQELSTRSIDVETALLVESFEDDSQEFGVLVTVDRRVVQFVYSYPPDDLDRGQMTEWNDLSARWQASPFRDEIAVGLGLVAG